ncbi:hypothetical protein LSAT2_023967 [Lamellibrachia satsuma]|nr:hypothetical protein LSAT2_023967 [Lamellibrachia satsuma]
MASLSTCHLELVVRGAIPYPGVLPERLCHLLKTGYRMEKPGNCSDELYDVMTRCWKDLPSDRPAFKELAATFENMLRHNVEYLDLGGASEKNPIVEDDDGTMSGEQMETAFSCIDEETPPGYDRMSETVDYDSYVIASSGREPCRSPKESAMAGLTYAPATGVVAAVETTENTTLLSPDKSVTNWVDRPCKQNSCVKLDDNENPEELRLLPEARI